MSIQLTSEAFTHEGPIPAQYACTGSNISPSLAWSEPPAGTQSFALIMDDPDASVGTWVHWVCSTFPLRRAWISGSNSIRGTLSDEA